MNAIVEVPERFELSIAKLIVRYLITEYAMESEHMDSFSEDVEVTEQVVLNDFDLYVTYRSDNSVVAVNELMVAASTNVSAALLDVDSYGRFEQEAKWPFAVYAEWLKSQRGDNFDSVIERVDSFHKAVKDRVVALS